MASPSLAETASFETLSVGAPPEGWLLTMTGRGAPKWTVERDEGGGAVLKQSVKATYPVALKEGTNIRDGFVEVNFKPISGQADRAGASSGGLGIGATTTLFEPTLSKTTSYSTRL